VKQLRASVELARQIELDLARDLAGLTHKEGYYSAGDGDVPQKYRRLVDEYYRNLARSRAVSGPAGKPTGPGEPK